LAACWNRKRQFIDGQIHVWEKGTPSSPIASAKQAIAGMDEAGVDRALIHPALGFLDTYRTLCLAPNSELRSFFQ
jgi:hypothetical protein